MIKDLTDAQRQALLDLVILTMYADGHLTTVEDARVEGLLTAMGFTDAFGRQQQFDASVTRVRPLAENPDQARAHAANLAAVFTSREQRRQIYQLLEEMVTSDAHITSVESQLLELVRAMFRV